MSTRLGRIADASIEFRPADTQQCRRMWKHRLLPLAAGLVGLSVGLAGVFLRAQLNDRLPHISAALVVGPPTVAGIVLYFHHIRRRSIASTGCKPADLLLSAHVQPTAKNQSPVDRRSEVPVRRRIRRQLLDTPRPGLPGIARSRSSSTERSSRPEWRPDPLKLRRQRRSWSSKVRCSTQSPSMPPTTPRRRPRLGCSHLPGAKPRRVPGPPSGPPSDMYSTNGISRKPWHGGCAEPRCVSQALDAGVDPSNGTMTAVQIGNGGVVPHGAVRPPCPSCEVLRDIFGYDQ